MHLKTALDYIRRSPFQAMAAICVLTVTFFVATVLAILVYASSQVLVYFETRPQVIAFLKQEATIEEVDQLQNRLRADQRIKDISFVSKDAALEIYKNATADNPLLGELVSPSIFPASIEFSLLDLAHADQVIEEVKADPIVESVGFTASLGSEDSLNEVVNKLKDVTLYIRIGGLLLILALGGTSLLVLMVIIGMRISMRRGEIETLNLIGAKPGFIKSPIVIEALVYTFSGVFFGFLVALILVLYLTPGILSYFGQIPVLPRETFSFFGLLLAILGGEILIGIVVALWGSLLAVSRALKTR